MFFFRNSPASLIVNYVKRILTQYTNSRTSLITPDLSLTTSYSLMPTSLLAEYIYVCRLIYSRTSGLLVIKRLQFQRILADTLKIEVHLSNDFIALPFLFVFILAGKKYFTLIKS